MRKAILVVGGAGGVGKAICQMLVEQGYNVVATVLDDGEAADLQSSIPAVEIHLVDLGNAGTSEQAIQAVVAGIPGDLAGIISCAGAAPYGVIETTPVSLLRKLCEINAFSNAILYQASIRRLRESGGRLILISSFTGKMAFPMLGYYSASKHCLEGLADSMRQEAALFGVNVILIEPGSIRTRMMQEQAAALRRDVEAIDEDMDRLYGTYLRGFSQVCENSSAQGLAPEAVASAILDALHANNPKPRYVVGEDAVTLLDQRSRASDMEMDGMVAAILRSAAEAAPR